MINFNHSQQLKEDRHVGAKGWNVRIWHVIVQWDHLKKSLMDVGSPKVIR